MKEVATGVMVFLRYCDTKVMVKFVQLSASIKSELQIDWNAWHIYEHELAELLNEL